TLDHVKSRVIALSHGPDGWIGRPLFDGDLDGFDDIQVGAVDPWASDALWVYRSGFTTPSTFARIEAPGEAERELRRLPALFDATDIEVSQHFATSEDGTRVPYFQVGRTDRLDSGDAPTLMRGYGGFEIPLLAGYEAVTGISWLEDGGVYVVANIRGGGEYGPDWHQAALKEKRPRAYEDFEAIAQDLVARGVTRPGRLGARGGSNGGLLMGNMYVRSPELWGAIVCQVPLLDMKRFTKLLAGASWAGEYGDPDDPQQWAHLQTISPYHRLADDGRAYPPLLLTTSTRDDRVHPGHARKFKAALAALERPGVWYYENIEGGHGGAANNEQSAYLGALAYTFLWQMLTRDDG
ncbi:MAG: prolyl oligopeptidase family serine peptidase, partial [Myxococcota bacterium]